METTGSSSKKRWQKLLPLGLTLAIVLGISGYAMATNKAPSADGAEVLSTGTESGNLVWTTQPAPVFVDGEVPEDYLEALDAAHQYSERFKLSESALFSQLTNETVGFSDDAARYAVANCHADWYEYAFTKAAILASSKYRTLDSLTATLTGSQGFTRPQAAYAVARIAAIRAVTIFS